MPQVSVILPFYNAQEFLSDAVKSVLDQTFSDFELLLINDGSTDTSLNVVATFHDSRIKLFNNEKNIGLIDSLNKGLENATGEFIIRMDADDICKPTRFKVQVEYMKKNNDVIVSGSQIEYFGSQKGVSDFYLNDPEIKSSLIFGSCFAHPSVIFRTTILKENHIRYRHNHLHLEDYDLWLQLMKFGKFANINEPLLNYRVGPQNITHINKATRENRLKSIYGEILGFLHIEPSEENQQLLFELAFNSAGINSYRKLAKFKKLILTQNSKINLFEPSALARVVNKKWERLFYIAADAGFNSTTQYVLAGGHINAKKIRYFFSGRFKK